MPTPAEQSAAIQQVVDLKRAMESAHLTTTTTFRGTIEIKHDSGIILVWGGKKAIAAGLPCVLRLAVPLPSKIPSVERLAKMGGLNISIPTDKVRWACNWTAEFLSRDWAPQREVPLTPKEETQLALARYIMIGMREEEEARHRKKLKRLAANVDYQREWRYEKKRLEGPRKAVKRKKAKRKEPREKVARAALKENKFKKKRHKH